MEDGQDEDGVEGAHWKTDKSWRAVPSDFAFGF
jgi:hypothetical protein